MYVVQPTIRESHLSTRRHSRPLIPTLCLAALLLLVIAPSAALASHRSSACSARSHARRAQHGCAHKPKTTKARRGRAPLPQHSRHSRSPHRHVISTPRIAALCEDRSPPVAGTEGLYCADGSEATCPNGATPLQPADVAALICPPGSNTVEATCTAEACAFEAEASASSEAPPCEACEPVSSEAAG